MMLTLLGLGLASYLAWVGIMTAISMPPLYVINGNLVLPNRVVYTTVVVVQYVIMVGIVLAMTIL